MHTFQINSTIEAVESVLKQKGFGRTNRNVAARLWCSDSMLARMLLIHERGKRSCEVEIVEAPWATESLEDVLQVFAGLSITLTLSGTSATALAKISDASVASDACAPDVVDPFADLGELSEEQDADYVNVLACEGEITAASKAIQLLDEDVGDAVEAEQTHVSSRSQADHVYESVPHTELRRETSFREAGTHARVAVALGSDGSRSNEQVAGVSNSEDILIDATVATE